MLAPVDSMAGWDGLEIVDGARIMCFMVENLVQNAQKSLLCEPFLASDLSIFSVYNQSLMSKKWRTKREPDSGEKNLWTFKAYEWL